MLKPTATKGAMSDSSRAALRFDEDDFDLGEHRKAADTVKREKARAERIRRQIKFGKIMLAIVTAIIIIVLFYVAVELGWMYFR